MDTDTCGNEHKDMIRGLRKKQIEFQLSFQYIEIYYNTITARENETSSVEHLREVS